MTIIYSGRVVLETELDNRTVIPLDYLEKGAVLNAHKFLTKGYHEVTVRCVTSVVYYFLDYDKLKKLSA